MRRRTVRILGTGIVGAGIAGMLLGVVGCVIHVGGHGLRVKAERVLDLDAALAAGAPLEATTPAGSIRVAGADTERCTVQVTITAYAGSEDAAQELAEAIDVHLEPGAAGLRLWADYPAAGRGRSFSIGYRITTGHAVALTCTTGSGSIDLADLRGSVRARTSSGSVRARDLSGGDVVCRSSSGSVSLTRGRDLGTCELGTSSGSVKALDVQAQALLLDTSSGSVTADPVTCARITGHTSSGGVRAVFTPETPADLDAELTTNSGSVRVVLPPAFGGRADIGTHSGSVHVKRPILVQGDLDRKQFQGRLGEGNGRLVAKTHSGSVTVE